MRAEARTMPLTTTVVASRWELAVRLDVIITEAVEAEADEVRQHQLCHPGQGPAVLATTTADLAEALGVRFHA
jgi:hypothetical protein